MSSLVAGQLVGALAGVLRAVVSSLLHGLLVPVSAYLLHTPPLLAQPGLRRLWLTALAALFALAGVLTAVAALAGIVTPRWRAGSAGRIVLGLLTAATALPLVALEAQLANALVDAFLPAGAELARGPLVGALTAAVAGSGTARLGLLLVAATGTILLAALALEALLRWAVLWLLVILAPLVMALGMLPGGVPTVRLWWRLQVGAVFLPVAHAALLAAYAALFASTRGLTAALAGVAVLALLARLPLWVAGQAVHLGPRELAGPGRRAALDLTRLRARATSPTSWKDSA